MGYKRWWTRGELFRYIFHRFRHLTNLSAYSGPFVAPPALRLHDVLPLPTTSEVPAHLHRVDIVPLTLPVDPVLPLSIPVPLVLHHPIAAASVPHPGPPPALGPHHHHHLAAGPVRLLLLLHLATAVTEVKGIAAAPRLEDVVSHQVLVGPFLIV
jgi:hypothetical protein